MAKMPPVEVPVILTPSEELLAKVIDKIDRIEIATILPDDVVFLYLPEDVEFDVANEIVEVFALTTALPNAIVPFIGDVRIEIVRPESEVT